MACDQEYPKGPCPSNIFLLTCFLLWKTLLEYEVKD
jgi:hypothetical protein